MVRRLVAAGASAIVLPSLFEEEMVHEEVELNLALEAGSEHFAEALDYFPNAASTRLSSPVDRHLDHARGGPRRRRRARHRQRQRHVVGSWIRYAALLADAGASAIELNVYDVAADASRSGAQLETDHIALVTGRLCCDRRARRREAVAVLLVARSPRPLFRRCRAPPGWSASTASTNRTSTSTPARCSPASSCRRRGSCAFRCGGSPSSARSLPDLSLAASSGIESGRDVAKALLVGADVAMMTSAVLRHGPEHVAQMEAELLAWADEHEYESVAQLRGSVSHATTADPAAFERANYVRTLHSWVSPATLTPDAPTTR